MDDRSGSRAPSVLHIGNVANNAYLNARLLRTAGVDCDVLSYAHYHIMGSPEWEECDFTDDVEEFHPDWTRVDLNGFRRPSWFAEGPFLVAAAYLETRRKGHAALALLRRRWLMTRRNLICGARWAGVRRLRAHVRRSRHIAPTVQDGHGLVQTERTEYAPLVNQFRHLFPAREDRLSTADIDAVRRPHGWTIERLRRLFGLYDVVHGYGTEPILPMLAGVRPWVAFEHGTIRSLPFDDSPLGRLTALAYRESDAVLITNADNRRAAEALGVTRYRFVPHPVSEYQPDASAVAALRVELRQRLNADFIVFHPSRQHWHLARDPHLEKGNDRLIEGLTRLFAERSKAAAVFVAWGATQDASRRLLQERGIGDRVVWVDPLPGPALARYMAASDVVADQFFLGAFGAITPRALYLGTPALLYLDIESHRWCFADVPPVLNASNADEIAAVLTRAYDNRGWLADLSQQGRAWYAQYHSNAVVRTTLLDTYAAVTHRI